jgi:hypothetical protein
MVKKDIKFFVLIENSAKFTRTKNDKLRTFLSLKILGHEIEFKFFDTNAKSSMSK